MGAVMIQSDKVELLKKAVIDEGTDPLTRLNGFGLEKPYKKTWVEEVSSYFSNTSDAVDDCYGWFSSFTSLHITVNASPFVVMWVILAVGYALMTKHQDEEFNKDLRNKIDNIDDKMISEEQYALWRKKLDRLPTTSFTDDVRDYVYKNDCQQIFKDVSSQSEINSVRFNWLFPDRETFEQHPSFKKLQLLLAQEKLAIEHVASKINNEEVSKQLSQLLEKKKVKEPNPTQTQKVKDTAIKCFKWVLKNYRIILSGLTLGATFGSLLFSIVGMSLLTWFPWNFVLAGGLGVLCAGGAYLHKRHFKQKKSAAVSILENKKNTQYDKWLMTNLLVQLNRIACDIDVAIQSGESILEKTPRATKKIDEFIDVTQLQAKRSTAVKVLAVIFPTVFALNAGYGIGATLLQLTILAGISPPILPFMIIGFSFAAIYCAHSLFKSYKKLKLDVTKRMNHLNNNIIPQSRFKYIQNQLRIVGSVGIHYRGHDVPVETFLKTRTIDEISAHILQSFRNLGEPKQNDLKELLVAHCAKIKTQELKKQCLGVIDASKLPKEEPADITIEAGLKEKAIKYAWKFIDYIKRHIQDIASGASLGLGLSASIIIFIWGASTLLSLPMSLGLLFAGAAFGITVSLGRRYTKNKHHENIEESDAVGDVISDKDRLMSMYIAILKSEKSLDNTPAKPSKNFKLAPLRRRNLMSSFNDEDGWTKHSSGHPGKSQATCPPRLPGENQDPVKSNGLFQ